MKHSFKLFFLYLFAVLFSACLPQEKLTGRVMDLSGPVPKAAVLAMVWVEETDKAKPVPVAEDLNPETRDASYDADMKDRGLPVAYARTFSDKNGEFTLDRLHFSAETKKAVKGMKQPKITRITLNVFQRGYLKHAATIFPKGAVEDLPPATVILSRPESWKELALDSSFRTLRRDEYDYGYSKEFGATEEEKEWFLEYTNSNLAKAYVESNIKGDKQWEEDCGHDYSDIVISTAGIQRNPAHEKCNRLLRQMGVLRDWKEQWLDHSIAITEKPEPSISAVKAALDALGSEYAEVKANEGYIIAGVDEAENQHRKSQTNQDMRNGLNENKTGTEEAQRIYNTGDKAGAYRVLGRGLYSQLPDEVRYGALTAQLTVKIIPGITDTVAGFYLLVNKPLTAQLPNGDNGNHKDKPGYKVEGSTETAGVSNNNVSSAGNPKEAVQVPDSSKQKITGTNVGGTAKKDYRIEVEKDKEDHAVLVKFISPGGKIVNTISPDKAITAKSGKSLIHQSGYRESPDMDYAEYERELLDARGKVKWRKSWKNYPEYGVDPEGGFSGWFEGISDNGERSYVTYRSTDGVYNLVVMDENGEELARTTNSDMFYEIEISPDGKIIGTKLALLSGKRRWLYLFFLDVDTGKTKLVKAEGEGWGGGFMLSSGGPLISGKLILEFWEKGNPNIYPWIYVEFANLPDDLSELFRKRGEKK